MVVPSVRSALPRGAAVTFRCNPLWTMVVGNLCILLWLLFSNEDTVETKGHFDSVAAAQTNKVPLDVQLRHPLMFEEGPAIALPSLRVETKEESSSVKRGIYGGAGDKKHLGGFTDIDPGGISPAAWKHMVRYFGVKSLLDVGCGRGISTSWFVLHGVDTLCVEGSHDAAEKSILPDPKTQVVEHDFSRGPWWPPKTVDAVWCVEFTEHVGRNFHKNYIPAFRKAALIFVSHSVWGGWHHVEVHDANWWREKFEMYGFRYSQHLTDQIHNVSKAERFANLESPTGDIYRPQHVWHSLQIFVNPVVASLPQHAHLLAEHGCFDGTRHSHKECGTGANGEGETQLPKEFYPLPVTDEMYKNWFNLVRKNIKWTKTQS